MVMQRDRGLNQPLQKLLLRPVRLPPDVLPNFVGIVEVLRVEEFYPTCVTLGFHDQILPEPRQEIEHAITPRSQHSPARGDKANDRSSETCFKPCRP